MKKIFALIGSRRKTGNTAKFVNSICRKLDQSFVESEIIFPQDLKIEHCTGCKKCFISTKCVLEDDMILLQDKILKADLFIIASPVYIHNISSDLKLILERISWWTHLLYLCGKPVVVLSTCSGNGFDSVIGPLGQYLTMMGGNVIIQKNASEFPHQINSPEWLEQATNDICETINKYLNVARKSNEKLECAFEINKARIIKQMVYENSIGEELGECEYWRETRMIMFDSFNEYLKSI